MKALVVGSNGQLGQALVESVPDSVQFTGFDVPDVNIADADSILAVVDRSSPDVIINAAAYTAVDHAESEVELAAAVNADGARFVAAAAKTVGARLIHVSTDFVFDGESSSPYTADAATNPLSVYGRTKRDGEQAVLELMPETAVVLRTSWLYSKSGSNFVKSMLRLMQDRDELGVVADQIGTPTWANSLAEAVWAFAEAPDLNGMFHWSDGGQCSWHEFAVSIQEEALELGLLDKAIPVRAIATEDYPTAAARPRYSVLDCSATHAALHLRPAPWRVNLRQMLKELNP